MPSSTGSGDGRASGAGKTRPVRACERKLPQRHLRDPVIVSLSRFLNAYENQGEALAERTETLRFYDLLPSSCLSTFQNRLVIDWSSDKVNWAKRGELGVGFRVTEIADAQARS